MDQVKIGQFIAQMRNEVKLTQKELAQKIGISDKTISKWETGKSLPDISYLETLCNSLNINMNELISGERLSESVYSQRAEENIMDLMKENEQAKKGMRVRTGMGFLFVGLTFVLIVFSMPYNAKGIVGGCLDLVSILMMVFLAFAEVFLSGKRKYQDVLSVLQKTAIPNGAFICVFSMITIFLQENEFTILLEYLSVCLITMLYGLLEYIVICILYERSKVQG